MRPDAIDTVTIYHSGDAPTGQETVLVETGPDTGIFTGSTPDLGDATLSFDAPIRANDPFTIETLQPRLSSSALTMIDEPLTLVESGTASPIFRTAALRLPSNLPMEMSLPARADSLQVSSIQLRTGAQTSQEAVTLAQAVPQAPIFSGRTPELGETLISLTSIEGSTDAPRVVHMGLSSSTLGLNGFYLRLSETGIATGRFITEPYAVIETPVAEVAPPPATLLGIENNPSTAAGVFEPVWIVARGLTGSMATDGLELDGDRFDLTAAPLNLPVTAGAPRLASQHVAQPILIVSERGTASRPKNVRTAGPDPKTVEPSQ